MVAPQVVPFLQTCTPFNFHKIGEHLIRNLATNNEKTPAEMTLWGLYTSFRLFIKVFELTANARKTISIQNVCRSLTPCSLTGTSIA